MKDLGEKLESLSRSEMISLIMKGTGITGKTVGNDIKEKKDNSPFDIRS